ncbi:MAG: alpha-L-rhamnosidase N-terminal domain-containing protein, partial [Fimbriimonadales bacterium]|nr:alpha-L-rhamnosidase N-terminal domain-containing protein [Fimbriimonadales bacterium]
MSGLRISHLRTEGLTNPLGIDQLLPRLSWQIRTARRGARQTAYHLQAASALELLLNAQPDLWDSGWQAGDDPTGVRYGGAPLQSRQRVYWRVRIQDERGRISAWSEPAWFETGLLHPTDWQAQWIAPSSAREPAVGVCRDPVHRPPATLCPRFRYEFDLPAPVRTARAYATGLGYYELYLNGRRVGDAVLEPSFTRFERRVEYATYDITRLL